MLCKKLHKHVYYECVVLDIGMLSVKYTYFKDIFFICFGNQA